MQRFAFPCALALAAALTMMPAMAAHLGPYGTGVDDNGLPLAHDAIDPHYQIVGSSVFGPATYVKLSGAPLDNGAWVRDGGAITASPDKYSAWLVPDRDLFFTDQPGVTDTITYRTQFDLSGFSAPGWKLEGAWAADDSGLMVTFNGAPLLGRPIAGADHWARFRITDGFLPGVNTLEFTTLSTQSPTGLRTEFFLTAVPEPSTWALLAAGLGLVALRRRGGAQ